MAEKTRNNGIELLRIISMAMIVCMHFYTHSELWKSIPVYSGIYYASHGLMALCRVAVDIFVLITGMFMVRKKFASRRIFSVMLMTWFYALALFAVYSIFVQGNFNGSVLFRSLLPITTKLYWFMTAYFAIMLLSPFVNKLLNSLSDKAWKLLIGIQILLYSVMYFVFPTADLFHLDKGYSVLWFTLVYSIGAYLGTHEQKKRPWILFYFILALVQFVGLQTIAEVKKQVPEAGDYSVFFSNYNGPLVLLQAVCIVIAFRQLGESHGDNAFLRFTGKFGKYAIGIYLIHENPYLRATLWKGIVDPNRFAKSPVIFAYLLLVVLIIIAAGLLVEFLRSKVAGKILSSKAAAKLCSKIDGMFSGL